MELEKLDNLNLGKENFSQEDIEDILGGVTEYDNYGIPDISCAGGSGSCKESCRDGCKDTQKKGSSCSEGCIRGCKEVTTQHPYGHE